MSSLWELREEFTDIIIICDNGQSTFKAHKIFLAAASTFLRNQVLTSDKLCFPSICKYDMETILESIYKGDPEMVIKVSQLEKTLYLKKPRISNTITSLPPEVLCKIISFLPTLDLLKKVALVSKQFNHLTQMPSVYKSVHLYSCSSDVAQFLKQAKFMTELQFHSKSGCKFTKIAPDQLLNSVGSNDHLKVLNFDTDLQAPYLFFIPLRTSKWWATLTQFNMEFEENDYKKITTDPKFALALSELGSSGHLTSFGMGCRSRVCSVALFNFIKSPKLSNLKRLTLYDNYDSSMLEEIAIARSGSLIILNILNFLSKISLPNFTNLRSLTVLSTLVSLDNLPNLQELKNLKILYYSEECKVPQSCLPNLNFLIVGSTIPEEPCHSNKVSFVRNLSRPSV